jgi:VanZ family protein
MPNKKLKLILRFWAPVIFWMGFIFLLSSVPGEDIPDIPIPYFHRVVHFIEYSILGALLIRAFLYSGLKLNVIKLTMLSVMLIALFAASDEWHQTFVPGRSGKSDDALFDVFSSLIGIYLYNKNRQRISKHPTLPPH